MTNASSKCSTAWHFNRENFDSDYTEFCTSGVEKDMHIDLYACRPKVPVIWGNVYDDCGVPIEDCLVRLVRLNENCSLQLSVIDQCRTDINGYYELELPNHYKGKYRIVVNSNSTTKKVVCNRKNNICYF